MQTSTQTRRHQFSILGVKSHWRTWKEREEGEDVCVDEEGDFPILRMNT